MPPGPPRGAKMAATAVPARSLFCMIYSTAFYILIKRATAQKSIWMPPQPPHYPKLVSERSGGSGPAADGQPSPPIVGVHGLMAHPILISSKFQCFDFPKFRCFDFPKFRCFDFPKFRCFEFPKFRCFDFPKFRCFDFPKFRCFDFPKFRFKLSMSESEFRFRLLTFDEIEILLKFHSDFIEISMLKSEFRYRNSYSDMDFVIGISNPTSEFRFRF
jgi:hypothetical protein